MNVNSKGIMDFMLDDGKGKFTLSNKDFKSETFKDFSIRPANGQVVELENVTFDRCIVLGGRAAIRQGSSLKNVTFSNFQCREALHISAEVLLNNVKILGDETSAMLWVRPQNEGTDMIERMPDSSIVSLDIRDFMGEVSITGVATKNIIVKPELHAVLIIDRLKAVDWKGLNIGMLSYWKLMAKKVISDGSSEGVFSMPPKSGKNYEKSMKELEVLRSEGFID